MANDNTNELIFFSKCTYMWGKYHDFRILEIKLKLQVIYENIQVKQNFFALFK